MAQYTIDSLKKSPADFLYIFADETSFISKLEAKRAKIIRQKKANQIKLLNTSAIDAGSDYATWAAVVKSSLYETYNMTPAQMLIALAKGETVAGKNFSQGIYGIGTTAQTTFNQNGAVTVSSTTGKIYINGQLGGAQTPVYNNQGAVVGYSTIGSDGAQYSSVLYGGSFAANTYSNATGTAQYANGSAYDKTKAQNVWETVLTYIPYVTQMVDYILRSVGKTAITQQNTISSQSDWVEEKSDGTGLLLLAGGAAAVIALTK